MFADPLIHPKATDPMDPRAFRHTLANLAAGLDLVRDSLSDPQVSREEVLGFVVLACERMKSLLNQIDDDGSGVSR